MRCKCVSETAGGEFIRCGQMVFGERDHYCYYHAKMVDGLTTPAPRDCTDPDRVVAIYKVGSMNPIRTFDAEYVEVEAAAS